MIFVVGPLTSQHIQQWYKNYNEHLEYSPVKVFTVHPGGEKLPENFKVVSARLTGTRLDFIFLAPMVLWCFWFQRPRVINFHYASSYALLSLLLPNYGCRYLLHTWGSDINMTHDNKPSIKSWLVSKSLKKMAWINAPACHLKAKLVAMGANTKRVEVYQYGVDIDFLESIKCEKKLSKTVFVSNRNWQSTYRIPLVVESFLEWQKIQLNNSELWVFGRGNKNEELLLSKVIKRFQPSIQKKVKLFGYLPNHEMLKKISVAEFFISIPQQDGLPISLLEAMVLEIFPIVSDIDANREVLNVGFAQFLEGNDIKELVGVFESASKQDKAKKLKANAQYVYQNADQKVNLKRYYQVLRKAIETDTFDELTI